MAAPSPEDQVRFLTNIQRLLTEGAFTATYKYALLLALADLAVEHGDDSGDPMAVPTRLIAERFIGLYWQHAALYVPPGGDGVVLQQNADRQASVINSLVAARRTHNASLHDLRRNPRAWHGLVGRIQSVFWNQPLWRLQRAGNHVVDFLYENRELGTRVEEIELRPGVAFCLRQIYALITELVRGAWLQYIRRTNAQALGNATDLSEFLFGSERNNLFAIRPVLADLQAGRCFYCHKDMKISDVDHFIPWSRYPVDLGHNFVLAHCSCNSAKGAMLAAEEHLARWVDRNRDHGAEIARECDRARVAHDLGASLQVAKWAYRQTVQAGGLAWIESRRFCPAASVWPV